MVGPGHAAWHHTRRSQPFYTLPWSADAVRAGRCKQGGSGSTALPPASDTLDIGDCRVQHRLLAGRSAAGIPETPARLSAPAAGIAARHCEYYRYTGISPQPSQWAFFVCDAGCGQPVAGAEPQVARGW